MGGGAEPRGARLGEAGKTAVPSCTAGPLSDPKEGEVRWQGVRLGVAGIFDHQEGVNTAATLTPLVEGEGEHGCRWDGESLHPG